MDFCVKCGKKEVFAEGLCRKCYEHEYGKKEKKNKKKLKKELPKHPLYYEAILQLRNPNKQVVGFVEKEIKKKKQGVAKKEEVKNGYDYYLADQKFARQMGRELRKKFGGIVKTSAKLYSVSRQTGKQIYRLTVLYRKPPFKTGDKIEMRGEQVRIKSVGGKEITGILENGKKVKYRYRDLERWGVI